MILFCVHSSPHMAKLLGRTMAALRAAGFPAAILAWGERAQREYEALGFPAHAAHPSWELPAVLEAEVKTYLASLSDLSQLPPYRGFDLQDLLRYEWQTPPEQMNRPEFLEQIEKGVRNLALADLLFSLAQPRVVVVWNPLCLPGLAVAAVARRNGAAVLCIERGPLPYLAQCDECGVNAGLSLVQEILPDRLPDEDLAWASRLVRNYLASDESTWDQPPRVPAATLKEALQIPDDARLVLFPTQVFNDSNVTIYSPFGMDYTAVYDWLKIAYSAQPRTVLIVKKHPKASENAQYCQRVLGSMARWVEQGHIRQWIEVCHHVVCINSTAGFEALLHGKPVLLMGRAFYGGPSLPSRNLTLDADSPEKLRDNVSKILHQPGCANDLASRAERFVAFLRNRSVLLDSRDDEDVARFAKRLQVLICSVSPPCLPPRDTAIPELGLLNGLHLARQAERDARLWKENYRRLAHAFPVRQLLWLRRRMLGLVDPEER